MRINQRSHNQEQVRREEIGASKVYEKYKNHIQELIQDSELSFNSIQTPGWTSLVGTQHSKTSNLIKKAKHQANADTHIQILNRLNSLPKLKDHQNCYSNIRIIPSSSKSKNLFVYGSLNNEEKKKMQTPKSRLPQTSPRQSHQSTKRSQKRLPSPKDRQINQFGSNNKPKIFFSVEKNSQSRLKDDSRKRTLSVRSQGNQNLKQKIKERLSLGNYKPKNAHQNFQSYIKTQPNENHATLAGSKSTNKFYTQIHSLQPIKQDKNLYLNRYLNKLQQRSKQQKGVKIFKKPVEKQKAQNEKITTTGKNSFLNKQNKDPSSAKRFNSITVYDHLYQNGLKLESKKQMQRIIDDSYQKATTLTFTPFVSEKSHFLASSKFSKLNSAQPEKDNHFLSCFSKNIRQASQHGEKNTGIFTIKQRISLKQKQRMAQKNNENSLIKLFQFLSDNTAFVNDKTVQVNIQKLPLSLLQLLEPFLTLVYKKIVFDLKKFVDIFSISNQNSIKEISVKKQAIISQTQRFFRHLAANQKRNKQNNPDHLNSGLQSELNGK